MNTKHLRGHYLRRDVKRGLRFMRRRDAGLPMSRRQTDLAVLALRYSGPKTADLIRRIKTLPIGYTGEKK